MSRGPARIVRPKPPTEKPVQAQCIKLLTLAGFDVGSTSQYRRSRIMEGLPDLIAFHRTLPLFLLWETKAPLRHAGYDPFDERTWIPKPLSEKQEAFRANALRCGQRHGWGGVPQLKEYLVELGLAEPFGSTIRVKCSR